MEKSERFDGESRFVNMEGFLPWRRRSHRTRNCVKERKRYGSLNRNEFRREEDDDVSLDRICSKRILEDTRFAFHGYSIIENKNFACRNFEITNLSG